VHRITDKPAQKQGPLKTREVRQTSMHSLIQGPSANKNKKLETVNRRPLSSEPVNLDEENNQT